MDGLRQSKDIPSSLDVAATGRNAPPIWPSESIPFHNSEEKPSEPLIYARMPELAQRSLSLREDLCEKKISPLPPLREGGVFMSLLEWGEGGHGGWERRKKERRKEEEEGKRGRALSCCNANVFMVDIGTRKPCSDMRGRLVSERIRRLRATEICQCIAPGSNLGCTSA